MDAAYLNGLAANMVHNKEALITAVLFFGATATIYYLQKRRPLPPGPKRVSIWGTSYERPPLIQPWKAYHRWAIQYASSLIYLKLRGRDVIVINKVETAFELLEKRSLNYSSRPDLPMINLIGRQDNVAFQRYGLRLKKCRKLLHDALSARTINTWSPSLENETITFLERLLSSPHDVEGAVRSYVGAFIVRFTYGQELNQEYLELVEETSKHSSAAMTPGRWLIDSFPIMKHYPAWAPGGGFQAWATNARDLFREFTQKPFNKVKSQLHDPNVRPSFVHDNLINMESRTSDEEAILAGTAASLYSAATDTTTSVLLIFFLMMTLHPNIQEEAFREIISIVGSDRLPTLADSQRLPYIEALIKEVHRFHPVVPLMPRSPQQGDEYMGQRIPKKAWLFTNIWAMAHDEDEYINPQSFNPARFIPKEKDCAIPRDPRDMTFGFGRRKCPGVTLANTALYLVIVRFLALFRLEPTKDDAGNHIYPSIDFVTAFISSPKPFKCIAIPRSFASVALIREERINTDIS